MNDRNGQEERDSMDRDDEAWRSLWTLEMISRTALHQFRVTARVTRSPNNPKIDRISLENKDSLDPSRWIWATFPSSSWHCGWKEVLSA